MKITTTEKADGAVLLKVEVAQADYSEAVEKTLRDYKRKANVPGFRPGMVPMGIVKKMYGKGVVAEESYRTASKAAFDYLDKNKIDYVGDVIPAEEQGAFDFENNVDHEFMFEYGPAPKFDVAFSAKDKLEYNTIKIDKKMHKNYLDNYLRRYGKLEDVKKVKAEEALTVTLDNGELHVDDAYIGLISMSEEERAPFIGKKVGDKMAVDINTLFKTPSTRAAQLKIKEDELESINPNFSLEINQIREFRNPELNEEFFKTAFPEGNVKDAAELDTFIDAEITRETKRECDYMFAQKVRNFTVEKAALKMPEAFLKRWLYTINEQKFTMEQIEKDFEPFLKMFTWNYIQRQIITAQQISVSSDEAMELAKELAAAQFAQYGLANPPQDMVENFAKNILENKEQSQHLYEKAYEDKVVAYVKSQIKVAEKAVSADDFAKMASELQ